MEKAIPDVGLMQELAVLEDVHVLVIEIRVRTKHNMQYRKWTETTTGQFH